MKLEQKDIRKLVLQAIYLDDTLSDLMVLKGGSALSIQNLTKRESYDLDFSLLELIEYEKFESTFKTAIDTYFTENDYKVFTFKFSERPKRKSDTGPYLEDWGGFNIEFKFIPLSEYTELKATTNPKTLTSACSNAFSKMIGTHSAVKVELSKKEFCDNYNEAEVDGVYIKLYTPEMIIIEKLRAICQQMPEYTKRGKKAQRARDFFDIYTVDKVYPLMSNDLSDLKYLLKNIFSIKEVEVELLTKFDDARDFHRDDFQSVKDVVSPGELEHLKSYDFYFDEAKKIAEWAHENLVD